MRITASTAGMLPITGGTMSGQLVLADMDYPIAFPRAGDDTWYWSKPAGVSRISAYFGAGHSNPFYIDQYGYLVMTAIGAAQALSVSPGYFRVDEQLVIDLFWN